MTIQLELWHALVMFGAICGAFFTMAKMLLSQAKKQIDEKFVELNAHLKKQDEDVRNLERSLSAHQLEMARDYTRREDHVQAFSTIMVKIDALALNIQRTLIELANKIGDTKK